MAKDLILITLMALIAFSDYVYGKIPNFCTFTGIIFGIILTALYNREALVYTIFFIVFLFFFGMLGIINMGDLKLWMMLVALTSVLTGTVIFGISLVITLIIGLTVSPKENIAKIKTGVSSFSLNEAQTVKTGPRYPIGFSACLVTYAYILGASFR